MSHYTAPTVDTHIPLRGDLPEENTNSMSDRADIPPPSLWQSSVRATHKVTKKPAVVVRVDWATNMFRAYYPSEGPLDEAGTPTGRFSERTEWEHCRDWDVDVTFSPKELERQAARKQLADAIAELDPAALAWVKILCDDEDPSKALGKLEALRAAGIIKAPTAVVQAAVEAEEPKTGPRRVPKPPVKTEP